MARPPKPLHTLRFHQMRLSFMVGMLFLFAVSGHRDSMMFIPAMISWVYMGIDLCAIISRKKGAVSAPALKYEPGNATEYERIVKAIPAFLGAWCLSLVAAITLLKNDSVPLSLRIIAILLSNLVSFTGFRWLQEVGKMIAAYRRQRRSARGIPIAAPLPQAQHSTSIQTRKAAQP